VCANFGLSSGGGLGCGQCSWRGAPTARLNAQRSPGVHLRYDKAPFVSKTSSIAHQAACLQWLSATDDRAMCGVLIR
jgi:hypothetical protein